MLIQRSTQVRTVPLRWDPLGTETVAGADLKTGRHLPSAAPDLIARFRALPRYVRITGLILITVLFLPGILMTLMAMALGGGRQAAGQLVVSLVSLGFFCLVGVMVVRNFMKATANRYRAPAIRTPVSEAAAALDLDPRGPVSAARLTLLRTSLGDLYPALGLPDAAQADLSREAPDEFWGSLPDGSDLWCLVKTSEVPLAGVPEERRGGRPVTPQARGTALTMLLAFPLTHRRDFRLEILHRVIQVMFVRVAATIDTGSAAFNNRFLVATRGTADELAVHRAVTPALQAVLLDLAERFWLVGVVMNDDTVFVSAMDFNPAGEDTRPAARWIEAALGEAIAATGRIRTYLD